MPSSQLALSTITGAEPSPSLALILFFSQFQCRNSGLQSRSGGSCLVSCLGCFLSLCSSHPTPRSYPALLFNSLHFLPSISFPFSGPEVRPYTLHLLFNWKPEAVSSNTLVLFQEFYTTYSKTHLLQVNILYPPQKGNVHVLMGDCF